MKRTVDRLVLVLLSSLLMTTGLPDAAPVSAGNLPTSANAEAQMAQRAKRGVGGRGARKKTSRLPSKARVAVGGGGLFDFDFCDDLPMISSEVEAFKMFPADGRVELGDPHVVQDLMVHACPPSSDPGGRHPSDDGYVYRLLAPGGEVLHEVRDQPLGYDFTPDAEEGEYQLLISGPSGDHRRVLTVSAYTGPRMELAPEAGLIVDWVSGSVELSLQDALEVRISGFDARTQIEVALYEQVSEAGDVALSDSWVIATDKNGEYVDTLVFEPSVEPGEYLLVACGLDDCDWRFIEGQPYGPPGGIHPPPMVWERFLIEADGESAGAGGASNVTCRTQYAVRAGDTLARIARRFDVTVAQLKETNGIKNADLISIDQRLCIPGGGKG